MDKREEREKKIDYYQMFIAKLEIQIESNQIVLERAKERLIQLETESEDDKDDH